MKKPFQRNLLTAFAVVLIITFAANAEQPDAQDKKAPIPTSTNLRVHFEVIEITLTAEQLNQIDTSDKPVDLEAIAISNLSDGNARVRYVLDSPVTVGKRIQLVSGANIPYPRNILVSDTGQTNKQIGYEDVGCKLNLRTSWSEPRQDNRISVNWELELEDLKMDQSVEISKGIFAPVFSKIKKESTSLCEIGDCSVFSIMTGQRIGNGDQTTGLAYVIHLCLDPMDESGEETGE